MSECAISIHKLRKGRDPSPGVPFETFVDKLAALTPRDALVSMIGGNHHQTFALARHAKPFWLAEEGLDGQGPPTGALIPRALARQVLRSLQEGEIARVHGLLAASRCQIFHVLSPPPRRFAEEILRTATEGPLIRAMRENGLNPAEVRMAAYRIQVEVLREEFRGSRLRFISPPPAALDELGFLRREFQADDATHANAQYGQAVLRLILGAIGEPSKAEELV